MKRLLCVCLSLVSVSLFAQKEFVLKSPNERLSVRIAIGDIIEYQVFHDTDTILDKSAISMTLSDGNRFGVNPKLTGTSKRTENATIHASVYKKTEIKDHYNELTLKFKGNYNILFRAYDDGMAYRFTTSLKSPFEVQNEQADFNLSTNQSTYIAYANRDYNTIESQFFNSFENIYEYRKFAEWDTRRLIFTPLVSEAANGKKVVILESDLINYPGMFLQNKEGNSSLNAVFATHPKDIEQGGHNMLQGIVTSREDYIARFDGATDFPWRAIVVADHDYELLNNDMVYKLATPSHGDYSWVKPGKVAWDWWNDWNLYGVDFQAGINTKTYKYYIDFASKFGIEYVILDEGWAVNGEADLYKIVPEINLPELAKYAESKGVGLILWAGYWALNRDMEGVCSHYAKIGIKGFKVDFMDRDDQPIVNFHSQLGEIAAKHKLLIDFHGTYKPTGLQRTFPNVINFEGVYGLEQLKWGTSDQVTYDVTMPFIRMLAGPVDYTQGAMRNASRGNFKAVYGEGMSQGTRCRQLAEYVIFESPITMLSDSPSNYMNEEECTRFIASVPTVWDETVAVNGKIGEYITIARRKGNDWYLGAITNWNERELDLDLSFLKDGDFKAEVFRDGINANKAARDYKKETVDIPDGHKMKIKMANGGGFVMKISRIK